MKEKAVAYARKAHKGQVRKGTDREYIVHPLEVLAILETMTEDEEILCAGVLHDTIEDCEGVTIEALAGQFGMRVAKLVEQESEDKSKSWLERKTNTILRIGCASREVQMIALADKLSNIRDIARDYETAGESLWERFRMKDKKIIGWYYKELQKALSAMAGTDAYQEYGRIVEEIFGKETAEKGGSHE